MPFSINIRSDDPSCQKIRELWALCASLEDQPSMVSLGYPPHFTLAVFDNAQESELTSLVGVLASAVSRVSVSFNRLSYFETPTSIVLWAAPADPAPLAEIHRQVHARIDCESCWPNYRPGTWIPHCSLAIDVDPARRKEAMAIAHSEIAPFDVVFDVLDCARFHPVEVLYERVLPGGA